MAPAILKRCTTCKLELPRDDYSADARASDGLQSRCRACAREAKRKRYASDPAAARQRQRDYYENNKERVLASNAKSRAKYPEKIAERKRAYYERVKDSPEFIARRDELAAKNKDGKREYDRAYRAANEEHLKAIKLEWRAKNALAVRMIRFTYVAKRRAQVRAGDSSRKIRQWVDAQKKVCHWCGKKCKDDFHIDHIQPLARGGLHVTTNLCIACPTCNIRKNARDPIEFAQSLGLLL
jgi:5-methylcytosine-specific restriction endonuclease McrA